MSTIMFTSKQSILHLITINQGRKHSAKSRFFHYLRTFKKMVPFWYPLWWSIVKQLRQNFIRNLSQQIVESIEYLYFLLQLKISSFHFNGPVIVLKKGQLCLRLRESLLTMAG
uniref:Uncharacterized protein n=1 Tax=Tetranychus urticae TaxID=32264 RepID=T1KWK9_TETUR